MRLDFLGVGFGRTGSTWLTHCLYEHPEISIPRFNLLTEINYFPEEYEIMGLGNYLRKFVKCDFEKVVGEISTLIIFKKRSVKLIKKLFPNTKIIIYKRNEEDRAISEYNVRKYFDLEENAEIKKVNQKELINLWINKFGEDKVHVFDMDNLDKQEELDKLHLFLNVCAFTPYSIDKGFGASCKNGIPKKTKYIWMRKIINNVKSKLKWNKKFYYTIKRSWNIDYIFQWINRRL